MEFFGVIVGDRLIVKLALTIYNIFEITAHVIEVTDSDIVATWDDIEDVRMREFRFDRNTGIANSLPRKYTKATCWIQRYDGTHPSEFRT